MRNNFAVFVSGYGRGAIEIIKDFNNGLIKPNLNLILSNNPNSHCLVVAKNNNINTKVIENDINKEKFEKKILKSLKKYKIEYIFLAGFDQILTDILLCEYKNKIINVHPSLLPSFKGLKAIDQALDYGVKITGVTVHYVNEEIDGGEIIEQIAVRIEEEDEFKALDNKIFKNGTILSTKCINKIFK